MKYLTIITLISAIFTISCSSIDVTNDWDKSVNFSKFSTFSLYPWNTFNDPTINDYDKKTIQMSVKEEMEKRGYKYVEKNGELIVSTFVVLSNKTSYQAYTNHYGGYAGYGGGWMYYGSPWAYGYGWGPGYSTTTVQKRKYVQGTLIIDIFELETKKLIWQGIGSGEVTQDLDARDRILPKRVSHIFRKYPIAKGKK